MNESAFVFTNNTEDNIRYQIANNPQLNLRDFMKLYSIFCFDFTAQDMEETNGYQVTIHINKDTEFKAKCC